MFIKLTRTGTYFSNFDKELKELDPKPIWVNTSKITLISNGYIWLGEESIPVKETPDEILRRIKEANNVTIRI